MLDDAYQLILEEVHHTYGTAPGRPVAATVVREVQRIMGERQAKIHAHPAAVARGVTVPLAIDADQHIVSVPQRCAEMHGLLPV